MFIKTLNPIVNEENMDTTFLFPLALILIVAGIIVVVLALLLSVGKSGNANVKGAGVIMIGPIPIVFGSDKKSVKTVIILALVLTIALIIWYYFLLR
jgi:uncharacterized protein (TIGR00304 family)